MTVKELAKKYYPKLWPLERLEALKHEDRDFAIAEAKLKRALARIHAKE